MGECRNYAATVYIKKKSPSLKSILTGNIDLPNINIVLILLDKN